jgi:hypothetical protein
MRPQGSTFRAYKPSTAKIAAATLLKLVVADWGWGLHPVGAARLGIAMAPIRKKARVTLRIDFFMAKAPIAQMCA